MKMRLHFRLQIQFHHHLRNPVRYRRYTQRPLASGSLRYLHCAHRRQEIASRLHPIPEFVEIPLEVALKLSNRLPVNTGSTSVCLYSLKRFPYNMLGNTKRLCFTQRFLPARVDHSIKLDNAAPSLWSHYEPSSLLRAAPPLCRPVSVLSPSWVLHLEFFLGTGTTASHVLHESLKSGSCHLYAGRRPGSQQVSPELIPTLCR